MAGSTKLIGGPKLIIQYSQQFPLSKLVIHLHQRKHIYIIGVVIQIWITQLNFVIDAWYIHSWFSQIFSYEGKIKLYFHSQKEWLCSCYSLLALLSDNNDEPNINNINGLNNMYSLVIQTLKYLLLSFELQNILYH